MRDHGGNIDAAKARWGGSDWIDLSTGINRCPYPIPDLPPEAWTMLPTHAQKDALFSVAQSTYGTHAPGLAVAGAQAAIQMIPFLSPPGSASILAPTYNEHAATLREASWQVEEVSALQDLAGADLAVVVNPNNPDGRRYMPADLLALAPKTGRLIVDESFADTDPELSIAPQAGQDGLIVLRSFGKFYGLAGVRLGFAFGPKADISVLKQRSGPWPVSGAAIEIGRQALADKHWQEATLKRLRAEAIKLDNIAHRAGWACVGGTSLFRLYDTDCATKAQDQLAKAQIWSRIFPWSDRYIRLGLPGGNAEWDRLARALA